MSEAYAWSEGALYIWSGRHTASGSVYAYAQSVSVAMARGWSNDPTLIGVYRDHLTSKRANIQVGALYVPGGRLQTLADAETAVHFKFLHSNGLGSAGLMCWSGRIDSLTLAGSDAGVFQYTLAAHSNLWSAFG